MNNPEQRGRYTPGAFYRSSGKTRSPHVLEMQWFYLDIADLDLCYEQLMQVTISLLLAQR